MKDEGYGDLLLDEHGVEAEIYDNGGEWTIDVSVPTDRGGTELVEIVITHCPRCGEKLC
jgi:hypothetical protein